MNYIVNLGYKYWKVLNGEMKVQKIDELKRWYR